MWKMTHFSLFMDCLNQWTAIILSLFHLINLPDELLGAKQSKLAFFSVIGRNQVKKTQSCVPINRWSIRKMFNFKTLDEHFLSHICRLKLKSRSLNYFRVGSQRRNNLVRWLLRTIAWQFGLQFCCYYLIVGRRFNFKQANCNIKSSYVTEFF